MAQLKSTQVNEPKTFFLNALESERRRLRLVINPKQNKNFPSNC